MRKKNKEEKEEIALAASRCLSVSLSFPPLKTPQREAILYLTRSDLISSDPPLPRPLSFSLSRALLRLPESSARRR